MPRVLYLVHGFPPQESTGTPLVAQGYAQLVASRGWEVAVVHADPGLRRWPSPPREADLHEGEYLEVAVPQGNYAGWAIEAASVPSDPSADSDVFFSGVLDVLRPDVVHVVDNVHMPLDWPELAAARHVPVVRTVSCAEDLCGLIAPVSALSDPPGYCLAPLSPERCATCVASMLPVEWGRPTEESHTVHAADRRMAEVILSSRHRRLVGDLVRKRERARFQFESVFSRVVFSTEAFRRYFEETLPLDPARVRVVEMGLDTDRWTWPLPGHRALEGIVTFCHAGTLGATKGHEKLAEAFTSPELLGRADYRLLVLGEFEAEVLEPMLEANPAIEALGAYDPARLPDLLSRAQVGISTSRFETFHRVTREYLLAGLPVVASPTFGIAGLIRDGENGLVFDYSEPGSLTRAVLRLLDDRGLLRHLTSGARATAVRSLQTEVDELLGIYGELVGESTNTGLADLSRDGAAGGYQ